MTYHISLAFDVLSYFMFKVLHKIHVQIKNHYFEKHTGFRGKSETHVLLDVNASFACQDVIESFLDLDVMRA